MKKTKKGCATVGERALGSKIKSQLSAKKSSYSQSADGNGGKR